jgi:HEAT repeat protein
VERVIELYLAQRGDSAWSRTAATLLRFAVPSSIQSVIDRLVQESDARNRLALIRLAGQLGSASIEVATKYLSDERWYVVRNMCGVLTELRDPQLAEHVAPALRHSDARVQQAALNALCKTLSTKTAQTLADSIPALAPQVLDEALNQLLYLRNPNTISSLENFVASSRGNVVRATKAVRALGAIEEPTALSALARLVRIEELDPAIRKAALTAISGQHSPAATQVLQDLASSSGSWAEDAKKALAKRSPQS